MPHSALFKRRYERAALGCNAERVTARDKLARKRQYMRLRAAAFHSLSEHKYPHFLTPKGKH